MKRFVRNVAIACCTAALVGGASLHTTSIAGAKGYKVVIVTKAETISVFQDVESGAAAAATVLGDTFSHTGPSSPIAAQQHDEIVNNLIPTHPDAIGVSANDPQVVGSALAAAQKKGIKTFTWDSDVTPSARAIFVNQVPAPLVGLTLARMACHDVPGCKGQIAVLSATTTSTNQNAWIAAMKRAIRSIPQYRKLRLVKIAYGNDDPAKSTTETQALLRAFPNLKAIVAPTSVGIVAAAKVVQTKGLKHKVDVTGLCFAKEMASFLRNGVSRQCALWSFKDLGYLSEYVGHYLAAGTLTGKQGESFNAGKLGNYKVLAGGEVVLGPLQQYNKSNVGYYLTHGSKCCG